MNSIKTGLLIQALRKSKGLTQQELAVDLAVSSKTVSKWECGDALPEISTLILISEYFDVTVDELLKGDRQGPSKQVSDDTSARFQVKKEKYIKQKTQSRLSMFSYISIGLLLVGLGVMLLSTLFYFIVLIVLSILLLLASIIVFIIGFTQTMIDYDEVIKEETITAIKASKFYFAYLYLILWIFPIFLTLLLNSTLVYRVRSILPLGSIFVIFIIYYYLREKRYGIITPPFVSYVIRIQSRYNAIYLFSMLSLLSYVFFASIYSYHYANVFYDVTFLNAMNDKQLLFPSFMFIGFFLLSIASYSFRFFKHKYPVLEYCLMSITSLLAIQIVLIHYENKMTWLKTLGLTSYGYSSPMLGQLTTLIAIGILGLLLTLLLPLISQNKKID